MITIYVIAGVASERLARKEVHTERAERGSDQAKPSLISMNRPRAPYGTYAFSLCCGIVNRPCASDQCAVGFGAEWYNRLAPPRAGVRLEKKLADPQWTNIKRCTAGRRRVVHWHNRFAPPSALTLIPKTGTVGFGVEWCNRLTTPCACCPWWPIHPQSQACLSEGPQAAKDTTSFSSCQAHR